ncbi:hypothetical protein B0F90DRAFT_1695908 [Multifurca ochricompacta]|uniref:Uncharacterized protein n=1 Tax=Multifurca ochricompacta TaxID=376703 RepID=A0AAD4MA40_9AGAM|nr:hypothetical protein B0F90DRAFT_1695908 [Multifurca ochricompacta]
MLSGITLTCLILGFFVIAKDEPSTEEDQRVDWIGATLITSGLILIVFVLTDLPAAHKGWRDPYIIVLFAVGVCLVLLFAAWQYYLERRLEDPNLPHTYWTAPPLMKLTMWTRAHGRFALYYQTYLNLSPIHAMLRLLPMFFVGILANMMVACIIGRIDVVYIIAMGTFLTGCANVLFAVIDPSAPYWAFGFPSTCLIVLGADFMFAPGTLFISKVSLPHEQSVAGALFQAMTLIGSAIGVSVSTIVFTGVLRAESNRLGVAMDRGGDDAPLPAQLKAFKAAMWTGFAFCVLCTMLCVFLRGVGVVGHTSAPPKTTSDPEDRDLRDEKINKVEGR